MLGIWFNLSVSLSDIPFCLSWIFTAYPTDWPRFSKVPNTSTSISKGLIYGVFNYAHIWKGESTVVASVNPNVCHRADLVPKAWGILENIEFRFFSITLNTEVPDLPLQKIQVDHLALPASHGASWALGSVCLAQHILNNSSKAGSEQLAAKGISFLLGNWGNKEFEDSIWFTRQHRFFCALITGLLFNLRQVSAFILVSP